MLKAGCLGAAHGLIPFDLCHINEPIMADFFAPRAQLRAELVSNGCSR